jgi:hypothetical protein
MKTYYQGQVVQREMEADVKRDTVRQQKAVLMEKGRDVARNSTESWKNKGKLVHA